MPREGGRVDVRLSHDERGATVEVQDNGPGVPPEQQQLVFDKFRQGGDADHRPQGTGLGLPISRRIVEHFGGRLGLRQAPGEGACFYFELPWQHAQEGEGDAGDVGTAGIGSDAEAKADPDAGDGSTAEAGSRWGNRK